MFKVPIIVLKYTFLIVLAYGLTGLARANPSEPSQAGPKKAESKLSSPS